MRRTLLTLAAFAVLATGVACSAEQLMPNPGSAQPRAAVTQLDTTERAPEPIAHGGPLTPETTAPVAPTLEPVAPLADHPSSPSRRVPVEAPAPAAVNPQPAPVAAPAEVPVLAQPGPVVDEPVVEQQPGEVIGRQIDGPNGELCTVVDADLTVECEATP